MKMKIIVGAYWAPVRLDNEESANNGVMGRARGPFLLSFFLIQAPAIFEVGRAPDFVSATTTGQTLCQPRLPDFVSATTPQLRRRCMKKIHNFSNIGGFTPLWIFYFVSTTIVRLCVDPASQTLCQSRLCSSKTNNLDNVSGFTPLCIFCEE
jgi:hypothetical protein